jgi:hypothetical protein
MTCSEDEVMNTTVGGCVPKAPAPFQAVVVGGKRWLWDPALEVWAKVADIGSGSSETTGRAVAYDVREIL